MFILGDYESGVIRISRAISVSHDCSVNSSRKLLKNSEIGGLTIGLQWFYGNVI